jgi:AmmeMemoRadiSam system protein A
MLGEQDRRTLLRLARERITAHLEGREEHLPEPTPPLLEKSGAFVTLHRVSGGERVLRGCIGHIDASASLYDTVRSVAISAAFQDFRFPPVEADELPEIELEISAISPFREITSPEEIEPGTHGLFIRLGGSSGLLLPQVAREREWDREAFLAQTCRKAGLPPDAWQDPDAHISVFTAEVFDEASTGV